MTTNKEKELEAVFSKVKELLTGLSYGSITLVVQDGKVIQMEKNEKVRLK